jgi:dolichol-phosphate mannosyltransferase
MISVVVPIYNEIDVLPEFHQRTVVMLESLKEDWELIYVNEGSSDGSYEILARFSDCDARVILIDLSRNWGHQAALTAGIRAARGEAVVMIDGDLQDPPELIPEFVEKWRQGAEVVIAQRRSRKNTARAGFCCEDFTRYLGTYPTSLWKLTPAFLDCWTVRLRTLLSIWMSETVSFPGFAPG